MHSSTSSSERAVPERPWPRILLGVSLLLAPAVGGWEMYWRSEGFVTHDYVDDSGLWAIQRRRVDREGDSATVLIGSSRILFDADLEAWGELWDGRRPIQLALEGTSPRGVLTTLAEDEDFSGLLVIGVTEGLFFATRGGYLGAWPERAAKETPSQWLGQRIFMELEDLFAFIDWDTRLGSIIKRQPWPLREGMYADSDVRKLGRKNRERYTHLSPRVEHDSAYREIARNIWLEFLQMPPELRPPLTDATVDTIVTEVRRDVERIRSRGGEVAFVRFPSTGPFREAERMGLPRERYWDRLVAEVDAVGIHFEDHPELQGYLLPEWSHLSQSEATRFTRNLVPLLRAALAERRAAREGR
jgi:hypothetical protein